MNGNGSENHISHEISGPRKPIDLTTKLFEQKKVLIGGAELISLGPIVHRKERTAVSCPSSQGELNVFFSARTLLNELKKLGADFDTKQKEKYF